VPSNLGPSSPRIRNEREGRVCYCHSTELCHIPEDVRVCTVRLIKLKLNMSLRITQTVKNKSQHTLTTTRWFKCDRD